MLRKSQLVSQKLKKSRGYDLKTALVNTNAFDRAKRVSTGSVDGEVVMNRGVERRKSVSALQESMEGMEHPAIWVWYPWRMSPEPPVPALPSRRALKNVHGAIYTGLSPTQQRRHDEMFYGCARPASVDATHAAQHPFLTKIVSDTAGKAQGFPFWFKKYPTRQHAYQNRFNIPKEMLDGYTDDIKKALGPSMMTVKEMETAQKSMYRERFARHDFDYSSLAVSCASLAVSIRNLRNHLLTNPHNNIAKHKLKVRERALGGKLRLLRRANFRQYWSILRDHDVQDLVQPTNYPKYRWGDHWFYDWKKGFAVRTNVADFMDPRGLNGCVETGRSRAEVARDLGLNYTRSLNEREKKALSGQAKYYEKLAKFKAANPDRVRESQRVSFMRKFSGTFALMNKKGRVVDFPSTFRALIGTKVLRWRASRHGPT